MSVVRRWMLVLLVAVLSLGAPAVATASATTPPTGPTVATTAPVPTTAPVETMPAFERDLSECISAVPKPGCGHEPTQAGDRGGWLQWTLFGMMLLGIAFIGWRVVVGIRRGPRDA